MPSASQNFRDLYLCNVFHLFMISIPQLSPPCSDDTLSDFTIRWYISSFFDHAWIRRFFHCSDAFGWQCAVSFAKRLAQEFPTWQVSGSYYQPTFECFSLLTRLCVVAFTSRSVLSVSRLIAQVPRRTHCFECLLVSKRACI